MRKRVAVLGLDALSYEYLNKLVESGAFSFIGSLVRKYRGSVLEAIPPVTAPSWSSIMTGVNPGKHGIFSFFHYERNGDRWVQRVTTSYDLMHPRVHEMAVMEGRNAIVFNPIPDYPILPFPGTVVVSNLFFVDRQYSFPKEAGNYFFDNWADIVTASVSRGCEIMRRYAIVMEEYIKASERAISKEPDLLWINLNIPDAILHKCVRLLGKGIDRDEFRLYSLVDKLAKLLMDSFDILVIVSDHGFARYEKLASVNDILVEEGYAVKTAEPPNLNPVFSSRKKRYKETKEMRIPAWAFLLIKRLRLKKLGKSALHLVSKVLGKEIKVYSSSWVDVLKSDAFLPYHLFFGVLLNNKEKRSEVLMSLRKYNELITAKLPEEIYSGPYLSRGPDIVVLPRTDMGVWINPPYLLGKAWIRDRIYHHHPEGVLIVGGDADDIGLIPERVPNHAVAQIVMHYLGLPLPKTRDRIEKLEDGLLKGDPEKDYLGRWVLALRVMKRIRKNRAQRH